MVGVLICDQSAAFDLCDHYLLVEKLKLMGVGGKEAAWMLSYLTDRKQSCFVDGQLSSPLDLLACGVPQGSIGGPLLWLCFTCDQPDIIHDHIVDGQDLLRGCGGSDNAVSHDEQVQEPNNSDIQQREENNCGELVGYVDDGAYGYAHHDPVTLLRVLTTKYEKLEYWMNGNKLVIKPDKTHLRAMGTKGMAGKRS